MKKFTKVIALTAAMTMLFSTVVMADCGSSSSGSSCTTTYVQTESHETTTSTPAPVYTAPVATTTAPAATDSLSTANCAPTTVMNAYTAGVATGSADLAVAPVNAATVDYANLGAKILVSPTATVFKSVTLVGNAKNVSLAVPGLTKGQKVYVLAYDMATGTWKKISCKVTNGKITFKKGDAAIFSLVSDVMAP